MGNILPKGNFSLQDYEWSVGNFGSKTEKHCCLNYEIHEGSMAHSAKGESNFSVDMAHFHGNKKHSESNFNIT